MATPLSRELVPVPVKGGFKRPAKWLLLHPAGARDTGRDSSRSVVYVYLDAAESTHYALGSKDAPAWVASRASLCR